MLESTCFNNWHYGTSRMALKKNTVNIGVFNPRGVAQLLQNKELDVTVFRIYCSPKNRLMRTLSRELEPNVEEILRRYGTDNQDFQNLNFTYINIPNNTWEEYNDAVKKIFNSSGFKSV